MNRLVGHSVGESGFHPRASGTKVEEQRTLLARIPLVGDLQSAWLILLHCAAARANYLLRVVEPQSVAAYARAHDEGIWSCLCTLLNISPLQDEIIRSWESAIGDGRAGPPQRCTGECLGLLGKLGRLLAHDLCQNPEVARSFVQQLQGHPETPFLSAAASSARVLTGNGV